MCILQLLRSPTFHHGVGWIHKRVHMLRTGEKMPERGGTSIEGQSSGEAGATFADTDNQTDTKGAESLFRHFRDEVKNQFKDLQGGARRK